MKTNFTRQEMQEAFEQGLASGHNKTVLDKRNTQETMDGLREQYENHGIKVLTFEQWMDGRFDKI